MSDLGFVGLGIMGRPMALNLLKGHRRRVQDEAVNAGSTCGLGNPRLGNPHAPIGKHKPPVHSTHFRTG